MCLEDLGMLWFACWRPGLHSSFPAFHYDCWIPREWLYCVRKYGNQQDKWQGLRLFTGHKGKSFMVFLLCRTGVTRAAHMELLMAFLSHSNLYNWRHTDGTCLSERPGGILAALSDVIGGSNSRASCVLCSCYLVTSEVREHWWIPTVHPHEAFLAYLYFP